MRKINIEKLSVSKAALYRKYYEGSTLEQFLEDETDEVNRQKKLENVSRIQKSDYKKELKR